MASGENWFKHDIDSASVPRMEAFIRKTGAAGYGFFWRVVEEMHRTGKFEQTRTNLNIIKQNMNIDEQNFLFILGAAIGVGLWEQNGEFICSKRAEREIGERREKLNKISDKRAEAGRRSGEARRAIANKREQTRTRGEERRVDKNIYKESANALLFPPSLDNQKCREAWNAWKEFKLVEKNQKYKSTKTEEQALANWADKGPERFIAAIKHSIGNGYSGIFESKGSGGSSASARLTPAQRTMETANRILQRELEKENAQIRDDQNSD